jgi:hypothetical protein
MAAPIIQSSEGKEAQSSRLKATHKQNREEAQSSRLKATDKQNPKEAQSNT